VNLSQLLRLLQPLRVLLAALCYLLGAGIADYLGVDFLQDAFWLGLLWTILLQLTVALLASAFARPGLLAGAPEWPAEQARLAVRLTLAAGVLLIAIAGTTVLIQQRTVVTPPIYVVQIAAVLLVLGYSVPPLRLNQTDRGTGSTVSCGDFSVGISPAGRRLSAYSLVTFLSTLSRGCWLSFQTFATDQKYDRRTLRARSMGEAIYPSCVDSASYGL
jgi:hypothetical protein